MENGNKENNYLKIYKEILLKNKPPLCFEPWIHEDWSTGSQVAKNADRVQRQHRMGLIASREADVFE